MVFPFFHISLTSFHWSIKLQLSTIFFSIRSFTEFTKSFKTPLDSQPPCPLPTPRVYSNSCPFSRWSHPLVTLLLLPSIFLNIRVFSSESVLRIRRPKYRSFSSSINASNEYLGLISFRMDWLDLLAVQGSRVFSNTTVQKH